MVSSTVALVTQYSVDLSGELELLKVRGGEELC